MDTLSDAMRRLQADGYTGNWFATADFQLECNESGEVIDPTEVQIDHILRFEGQSDPGDMSILFALQTPAGQQGAVQRGVRRRDAGRGLRGDLAHATPDRRRHTGRITQGGTPS